MLLVFIPNTTEKHALIAICDQPAPTLDWWHRTNYETFLRADRYQRQNVGEMIVKFQLICYQAAPRGSISFSISLHVGSILANVSA